MRRDEYIEDTNKSRALTKLRIINTMGQVEKNDRGKHPNAIKISKHGSTKLAANCKPINGSRTNETQLLIRRKKLDGTSETDTTNIIVADVSEENIKQLEGIIYKWKTEGR